MTDRGTRLSCADVDEIGGAYLFGGVDHDEQLAVDEHLAACREPHAELRAGVSGELLAIGLEPVEPSPELRQRLMATIAGMPQEHAVLAAPMTVMAKPAERRRLAEPAAPRRGFFEWMGNGWARGMAAAAVVAVIALGAWNIGLQGRLSASEQVAQAIAGADTVRSVSGDAGRGILLQTGSAASFVATDMTGLPSDQLYEAWLIPADGAPLAVGVFRPDNGPLLVQLDDGLDGFATFALTVEQGRVDTPTGAPVLVASLSS